MTAAAIDFHPFADLFPMMNAGEFEALQADIKANGLVHPIVLQGGLILDGRNRYRACRALRIKPKFKAFGGDNPLAYVISANLQRRHLSESQRAMVAAKIANMPSHRPKDKSANLPTSQPDAAAMLHVSTRSVAHAKVVRELGTPLLIARVENGEIAVSLAAKVAAMAKEQQEALAEATEPALRSAGKKATRERRERELAEATERASQSLGQQLFGVIYADPPWRFAVRSENGLDRAADNHYQTMTTDEICALTVPAAEDAVLFMWATAPMLLHATAVMLAWGFDYKSHFVWVKNRIGTGYWARNKHELLLVGTRGKVPAPAPGTQFDSVIAHATDRHSRKPLLFAEMIEEMFPNAALLEMFAREARAGWTCWGNEAPGVAA